MKPIDIRPTTQFNTILLENIKLTKEDDEIKNSIENVEEAFLILKDLYETYHINPKTKYIKKDIQTVSRYIKRECKNITKMLKKKRNI
jgi:hypothetical protein